MSKKNIEGRVSETLFQDKIKAHIGKKVYPVERPTLGTLVLVAEHIAALPNFSPNKRVEEILAGCIHGRKVAEVLAVLIIGARRIKGRSLIDRLLRCRRNAGKLTDEILMNCSNGQIYNAITSILASAEIDDFFAVTTFLRTVNLLSARKVGEDGTMRTTASGQ